MQNVHNLMDLVDQVRIKLKNSSKIEENITVIWLQQSIGTHDFNGNGIGCLALQGRKQRSGMNHEMLTTKTAKIGQ